MLLRWHLSGRGNGADLITQEVSPTTTSTSVDVFMKNQFSATFIVNSVVMPSLRTPQSPKNGADTRPAMATSLRAFASKP